MIINGTWLPVLAFFWEYSGIEILGIDGVCVLLGASPFSECREYHSAPDSRMNRMEGIRAVYSE